MGALAVKYKVDLTPPVSVLAPFSLEGRKLLVRPGTFGRCTTEATHVFTGEPVDASVIEIHIPFGYALVFSARQSCCRCTL